MNLPTHSRLGILFALGLIAACGGRSTSLAAVTPNPEAIRAAVEQSLPLLTVGAQGSMEQRARCFTCHNQAFPILALTTAQARGFKVDTGELDRQLKFTA